MISRPDRIPTVTVDEAAAAHASAAEAGGVDGPGAILLDVRNPDEFVEARVPGAVLMPMGTIMARFRELPPERAIHVICRSGSRSASVTQFLVASGFGLVANVEGGMIAWLRAGHPAISGPLLEDEL